MTYWALNAIFLAVVVAALAAASILGRRRVGRRRLSWPALGITLAVLLLMTALFDNAMIGIGLVAYDESLISGAFIGIAPLEDFAYAVAAVSSMTCRWGINSRSVGRGIVRMSS